MRTFSRHNQFKRDVKRLMKRGKDMAKLRGLLNLIIEGHRLPPGYRDHPLAGQWRGSHDCHLEGDWILIYSLDEKRNHVVFERTGSHNDIFG